MKKLASNMRRGRLPGVALVALALVAVAGLAGDSGHARAAAKYTALVGGGKAGISVEAFLPTNIVINEGDTVDFMNPYEEIHTVTFLGPEKTAPEFIIPVGPPPKNGPPTLATNPKVGPPTPEKTYDGAKYANSGVLAKGQSWPLTFPKQGSYAFLCVIHPGMTGSVEVLAAGIHVPDQKQRDFESAQLFSAAIAKGDAAAAAARPGANEVINVPSVGQVDIMRFLPSRLSVAVGDTITFKNPTAVPHTITFTSGAPAPDLITDARGTLNPRALFPARTGPSYDGTGYVNSGFIGTGPEATAGSSFALSFSKAGTYQYICILHADQGMTGIIQVGAGGGSGVSITPPSTGDAGLTGEASMTPWLMAAAGVLAVGLSVVAIASKKLRA